MESSNSINRRKLIKSFGYAWTGIKDMLRTEQNSRIHLIVAISVVAAGFLFRIETWEWCVIALCIALVFAAEALNTVLEKLTDHLFPERHETARAAKDIAAGAVLICAMISVVCGLLIFLPKLVHLVTM